MVVKRRESDMVVVALGEERAVGGDWGPCVRCVGYKGRTIG